MLLQKLYKIATGHAFRFDEHGEPILVYEDEIYREIYFRLLLDVVSEEMSSEESKSQASEILYSAQRDGFSRYRWRNKRLDLVEEFCKGKTLPEILKLQRKFSQYLKKLALIDLRLARLRKGDVHVPAKYDDVIKIGTPMRAIEYLRKNKSLVAVQQKKNILVRVRGKSPQKKLFMMNFDFAFAPLIVKDIEGQLPDEDFQEEATVFWNAMAYIESKIANKYPSPNEYLHGGCIHSYLNDPRNEDMSIKQILRMAAKDLFIVGKDSRNLVRRLRLEKTMKKMSRRSGLQIVDELVRKVTNRVMRRRNHAALVNHITNDCIGFFVSENEYYQSFVARFVGGFTTSFVEDVEFSSP
ncbi:MAG: hypothetical protein NTV88_03080 [Candidatus Micrarchaeota archaeon]|nr:hypothetical protein [Candidatus Micrarchaeota archaeon]